MEVLFATEVATKSPPLGVVILTSQANFSGQSLRSHPIRTLIWSNIS